jgi:hypothetical protein
MITVASEACWWDGELIEDEPIVVLDHPFCSWECADEWMESFL